METRTGAQSRLPLPSGWTALDPLPESLTDPAASSVTVVALRVTAPDNSAAWLHTATGDIGGAGRRRLRSEQAALDETLRALTGSVLLPWLWHGDAKSVPGVAYPFLVCARPGPTFADDLIRGPLPTDRVVAAALICVDALAALHRHGRSHGLLAPRHLHHDATIAGGVRLTSPLPPVLAELVAVSGGTGHEPPEILRGGDPSPAADVFALASTCWTLLSGRPPFGAPGDQLTRLTATEPPPLPRGDVPRAMAAALRAALSPDPARRPDLRTFAQALRIVEDGAAPVSEVAAPSPPPSATPAQGPRQTTDERLDTLAPTRPVSDAGRPLGSRYLLDALIGRGATGHVWRGHVRDDGRPVAVKLLRSELAEDNEVVTRFMRERSALMRLSHPHLVAIHDLVAEGGALAIVMDLVDGRDLRTALAAGPIPLPAAAAVLSQTAAALAAVHEAGIVHRDLKPENIIVESTPTGPRARLTDFGLARAVESATLTRLTQLVGTPAYVAPEVVAGRTPGPAVDVYAFGITAYELLAGRRPFATTSPAAVLRAHLDETPRRPEGIPDELWPLIESCLHKDPAARPDAATLADSWGRVAAGQPVGAPAAAAPTPAPPSAPIDTPMRAPRTWSDPGGAREDSIAPDAQWSSSGTQHTTSAARPLAARHAHGEPEPKSRARLWWTLAAIVILGFGGGFAFVALGSDDPKPAAEQKGVYPLAASITLTTGAVPVVRWTLPAGVSSDASSVVIVKVQAGRQVPVTPQGLDPQNRTLNAATLRGGDCVIVYLVKPTKAPPKGTVNKQACVPKQAPSPSGSTTR